ncbi:hypothetical protein DSOL_5181 [Desulfosporosinus metallidurans]|uniref:Uncharacterized protein n=1 Tax=Desulfosporosinus metallidurans TaxID=1888891 RepID=A0A1Q8QEY9_9FIRM|nr:hypothetical protein DSOL_5181 [Desulfosporosinus metallidurans]
MQVLHRHSAVLAQGLVVVLAVVGDLKVREQHSVLLGVAHLDFAHASSSFPAQ